MAERSLLFLGPGTTWRPTPSSPSFWCGGKTVKDYRALELGHYAETDNVYVFCQSTEEAQASKKKYEQGLLTYKEIPVVRSTKHVELVFKDESMQKFKDHFKDVDNLDYQAMASALAVEEKKNLDQIVDRALAGLQQSVQNLDYQAEVSALMAEQKKTLDEIVGQLAPKVQSPIIDYDNLVLAFDRHIGDADRDAGTHWMLLLLILGSLVLAIGIHIMAVKDDRERRENRKKETDAYEELQRKYDALCCKDHPADPTEQKDNSASADGIKTVPTFSEYVHGNPEQLSPLQQLKITCPTTVSRGNFKMATDSLSGFQDPAERNLVEDMFRQATVEITCCQQETQRSRPTTDSGHRGGGDIAKNLVNKISIDNAKTKGTKVEAAADNGTHLLEETYKKTLEEGFRAISSEGHAGGKMDDEKRMDAPAASKHMAQKAKPSTTTSASSLGKMNAAKASDVGTPPKTPEPMAKDPTTWYRELCRMPLGQGPANEELLFIMASTSPQFYFGSAQTVCQEGPRVA